MVPRGVNQDVGYAHQHASNELVPCCWCESWVHWRCSYTVKSGRACASHFHVINPRDKVVVTRSDDETVPVEHRGLQVVPNTFLSKEHAKGTLKPSDLMIGLGNLLGL